MPLKVTTGKERNKQKAERRCSQKETLHCIKSRDSNFVEKKNEVRRTGKKKIFFLIKSQISMKKRKKGKFPNGGGGCL